MKKTTKLWFMLAIAGIAAISSCKKDEEVEPTNSPSTTEPDVCATANFPATTGSATINVLNYTGHHINVEANTVLALAVEVTEGDKNVQKLRLYQSDCINMLGDEVELANAGKKGVDLRRTNDPQVKNANYAVPTGFSTIYLTIEVDEAGGNLSYKQLTLEVSGSGIIDTWTGVELGAQLDARGSRVASCTGITYESCDAHENINEIDITYAAIGSPDALPTLLSNPERANIGLSTTIPISISCYDDGTANPTTAGGAATKFVATSITSTDFDAISDASGLTSNLDGLTIADASVSVVADGVYAFESTGGKKGLVKIVSVTQGTNSTDADLDGYVTVDIKVAR